MTSPRPPKRRPICSVLIGSAAGLIVICCLFSLLYGLATESMRTIGLLPTVRPTPIPTHRPTPHPTNTPIPTDTPQPPAPTPSPTNTPIPTDIPPPLGRVQAQVISVTDGDTIEVSIEGQTFTVRYIGIDTPETKHPDKPVESFGPEAAAQNEALVGGKIIELEKDVSETDQHGRLLRYVYVGDLMVNAELVRLGFAQVSTYPPDVKYQDLFLQFQREAREANRGLWGAPPEPAPLPTDTPQIAPTPPPAVECPYIGNSNTSKFHSAGCWCINQMNEEHKVCLHSREEAIANGYEPCGHCKP